MTIEDLLSEIKRLPKDKKLVLVNNLLQDIAISDLDYCESVPDDLSNRNSDNANMESYLKPFNFWDNDEDTIYDTL